MPVIEAQCASILPTLRARDLVRLGAHLHADRPFMYLAMRLPPVRESLMRQFVAAAVAAAGRAFTK